MKRIALAGIAATFLAAPLLAATPAAAHDRHERRHDDWDGPRDHDYRDGYRDGRRRERWDHRRHNGYWHDGRWYYGPPRYYSDDDYYAYRAWRRGERLPAYYRDHYRRVDWRDCGLRAPPRGHYYVYDDDRDEYLLVAVATGIILSAILAD